MGSAANNAIYVMIGVVVAVCVCFTCCFAAFAYITTTPDFKKGFCDSYVGEQGYSPEQAPFGWCDNYKG